MKKIITIALSAIMCLSLCSCTKDETSSSLEGTSTGDKTIYYLNFKPEIAEAYDEIAEAYKEETGVTLNVVTAASGTYEQTLKSEIAKTDAPTIFQINGPKGYVGWKDYCADITDSEIYKHLTDKNLAITSDDKVYGIPYVVEGYGIIYNDAIMRKYFELGSKTSAINSIEEINSFEKLKEVVEDMTANREALGIKGVFASTSLKSGEDWRWHSHLANIPIDYEFNTNDVDLMSDETNEIGFDYSDNFKNIFDLYINNSTVQPTLLGSKQVADSMAEFALGQCAMVQNGNWAWSQINGVSGNTVKEEDIKFMPIYTGVEGEETQGICIGTENFLCINKNASDEQKKLAEDFLYWLYSSKTGKDYVVNKLGFIAPFDTFEEDEKPTDPLAKEVINWMSKEDIKNVSWNFTLFPSQTFKDYFGAELLMYAQGTREWDELKDNVVDKWKSESNS